MRYGIMLDCRTSVLYIHPIKQGLKQLRDINFPLDFGGSLHTSNKTRIETYLLFVHVSELLSCSLHTSNKTRIETLCKELKN